jgi:hypothetical protein
MVIGFCCCCACTVKIRSNDDMTILYMVILMIETAMAEEHKAYYYCMVNGNIIVFPQFPHQYSGHWTRMADGSKWSMFFRIRSSANHAAEEHARIICGMWIDSRSRTVVPTMW